MEAMQSEKSNTTLTCECGNRKSSNAAGCDRCIYLDRPGHRLMALIICILRGTDGMTITELVAALEGINTDVASRRDQPNRQRSMLRTLQLLVADHRIRRYRRECDTVDMDFVHTRDRYGRVTGARPCAAGERGLRIGGSLAWVYALDGRTEDGR